MIFTASALVQSFSLRPRLPIGVVRQSALDNIRRNDVPPRPRLGTSALAVKLQERRPRSSKNETGTRRPKPAKTLTTSKSDRLFEEDSLLQISQYKDLIKEHCPDENELDKKFDPFRFQERGHVKIVDRPNVQNCGDGGPKMDEVWKARLLLVLAAALYGTNFTCVKLLNEAVPVEMGTALRFALAALATLPWLLAPSERGESSDRRVVGRAPNQNRIRGVWDSILSSSGIAAAIMGFEVGIWNSIGYVGQAVGLETMDASKSAFICSMAVVIVPILDHLAGKKILPREIAGAAMAVVGVGFLELGGGGDAMNSFTSGDVASLIQPLAFGIGFWRMEAGMRLFPQEAERMTAAQIFAVFVASTSFGLFALGADAPPLSQITTWLMDPMIFGALFWTGCVTTALTVYMETLALKTLSAAETTMIFSTEPLWGAAFASVVVGERLGLGAGLGAALILGGCVFSNIGNLEWFQASEKGCNETNVSDPHKDSIGQSLHKHLFGPSLLAGTPSLAAAAMNAVDRSTSPVSESIAETLREM